MKKRQAQPLSAVIPLSALVVAAVLVMNIDVKNNLHMPPPPTATISVEHSASATMRVAMSTGKGRGIIEFSADQQFAIRIPSTWQLREVRGIPLGSLKSDAPSIGIRRWRIPDGGTLSLWIENSPSLTIQNISPTPLLILGKRVNVVTGKTDEKSVLVQKASATLW